MGYTITKSGDYLLVTDGTTSLSLPLPVQVKTEGQSNVNIYSSTNALLFQSAIADYTTIGGDAAAATAAGIVAQLNTLCASSSSASYSVYTALLTQSGTDAPVVVNEDNGLGAAVTFHYDAEGFFYAASTAFTEGKTLPFIQNNGSYYGLAYGASIEPLFNEPGYPTKMCYIATRDAAGASLNGWGAPLSIMILVLP